MPACRPAGRLHFPLTSLFFHPDHRLGLDYLNSKAVLQEPHEGHGIRRGKDTAETQPGEIAIDDHLARIIAIELLGNVGSRRRIEDQLLLSPCNSRGSIHLLRTADAR